MARKNKPALDLSDDAAKALLQEHQVPEPPVLDSEPPQAAHDTPAVADNQKKPFVIRVRPIETYPQEGIERVETTNLTERETGISFSDAMKPSRKERRVLAEHVLRFKPNSQPKSWLKKATRETVAETQSVAEEFRDQRKLPGEYTIEF